MEYQAPIGAADPNDPYIDGNASTGTPGSPVPAAAIEHPQREIVNALKEFGVTPDSEDLTQLAGLLKQIASSTGKKLGEPYWHLGSHPPVGSMEFKGQLLARTVYAELWQALNEPGRNLSIVSDTVWLGGRIGAWSTGDGATNFRVPRMAGNFIRVLDTIDLIDPGRIIGDLQLDEIKEHDHDRTADGRLAPSRAGSDSSIDYRSLSASSNDLAYYSQKTGTTGGNETRPRNIAWMLCFRYQ